MEENQTVVTLRTVYDVKRVECVGLQFLKYLAETHPFDGGHLSHSSSDDKISDEDGKFEVDVDYLRSLDPKDWKNQDHYAVLGLKDLR
jgi:DnaJ family protein C protein 2